MQKSHLLNLFLTLSNAEIRNIQVWLSTPIHNKRKELVILFDWMCAEREKEGEERFTKQAAFKKLFPNKTYKDASIRILMSYLLKAIQDFLVYQKITEQHLDNQIHLANIYQERKLDKRLQQLIKNIKEKQASQPFRDADFYQREFLIFREENTFLAKQSRSRPMSLQKMDDALEINFIIQKLAQSCLTVSHQNVYKSDYQIGLLPEILAYIEQNDLLHIPAINLYYQGYKFLSEEENGTYFETFRKLIVQHQDIFPPAEIRVLYIMAINHCIQKINQESGSTYLQEAFSLYRLGIEKNFLLTNGIISRFTYRNIVSSGLKLKEFDWVIDFIHEYKKNLDRVFRESTFYYCLSRYYYEIGNYKEAMKILQQDKYTDLISNLAAKTLLIKIYYEHQENDVLDYFLISFEAFIKRKKEIGYHKANYLNIIRLMKKMQALPLYNKAAKLKLKEEVSSTQPLTERAWFLEQLK